MDLVRISPLHASITAEMHFLSTFSLQAYKTTVVVSSLSTSLKPPFTAFCSASHGGELHCLKLLANASLQRFVCCTHLLIKLLLR